MEDQKKIAAQASATGAPEYHSPYNYTAHAALVVPGSQKYDSKEPARRAGKNLDTSGAEIDSIGRGQLIGHY